MVAQARRTNYTKELTEEDIRRREGGWSATPIGQAASQDRTRSIRARKARNKKPTMDERRRRFEAYAKLLEELAG